MKTIKAALLAMTITCISVKAADAPLTLQGKIEKDDGSPNDRALVVAESEVKRENLKPASARTDPDGSFRITALSSGTFRLCVRSADKRMLDPCRWSAKAPTATISPAGSKQAPTIVLQRGRRLELTMIYDNLSAVDKKEHILVGVWRANGLFVPLPDRPGDVNFRTRELYIPRDESLQLSLHAKSGVVLAAAKDAARIHANNTLIPISAGESDLQYTVHITK